MNKYLFFFLFFSFNGVIAQTTNATISLLNDVDLRHAQLGVHVIDLNSGQVLIASGSEQLLIPASTQKLLVTASALAMLGTEYRIKTELQYDGKIEDGVLKGNLFIKGYGDPTLGSHEWENAEGFINTVFYEVQKLGIKRIEGAVVGDASLFESRGVGDTWEWADMGNYYASGAFGLNYHENYTYLNVYQSPNEGMTVGVSEAYPKVPNTDFYSEVITKASSDKDGDDVLVFGVPYQSKRIVRGEIPTGYNAVSVRASVPEPAHWAAWQIRQRLVGNGIEVTDTATTVWIAEQNRKPFSTYRTTFYTWLSPTVSAIVNRTNQESNNLYAEALLKIIAQQREGFGSTEKGLKIMKDYWQSRGWSAEGIRFRDASGLSPRNGISARHLTEFLRIIYQDTQLYPNFASSLPLAGESGTLKGMFKKSPIRGVLRAKSGTITDVKAYSGYLTTRNGRQIGFTIMANNFSCSQKEIRKKLEVLMESFYEL